MVIIGIEDKKISDIGLFVFDKDGTIIDLYTYWYHMIELRAKKICSFYNLELSKHKENLMFEMGIDIENKKLKPEGPVGLLPREVVQKAAEDYLLKLGERNVSQGCFEIFKEVDELSKRFFDKFIKPIKGAIELLKKIKKKGCKIAIATTDKTERAKLAATFLNINNMIDTIVGTDEVKHAKPAPDMLNLICKRTKVDPAKAVMVGDAKTDINMGINAKFKASIGVCSGLTKREALSKITPYVVNDVSQINIE